MIPLGALSYLLSPINILTEIIFGCSWVRVNSARWHCNHLGALVSNQICNNIDLQTFWGVLLHENIAYILIINGPFSADVSRAHTNVSDSGKRPTNQLLAAYMKVLSSLTVFAITNITINPLKSHSTRPKNLMYYVLTLY